MAIRGSPVWRNKIRFRHELHSPAKLHREPLAVLLGDERISDR